MFTPTAIFAKQAAAVGPVIPIPTTNLIMWLDAQEGITTSGGYVTDWADQSGTSNDATGQNGGVTYATSIASINNLNALDFAYNDTRFMAYTNALVPNQNDGLHIFLVGTQDYDGRMAGNYYPAFISEGDASRQVLGLVGKKYPETYIAPATDNYAAGGAYNNGSSTYTSGTFYTWEWQMEDWYNHQFSPYINVSTIFRMNGSSIGTLLDWSSSQTGRNTTKKWIGNFKDTTTGGGGSMLEGYIAEIIAYSAPLSSGDAATVRSYLQTKYGHY